MKILITLPIMIFAVSAFAQDRHGMNGQEMQKLMEEMQKVQACMAKIDHGKFSDIEQRQMKFEEEVKPLCASGRRDEAQKLAMDFGKEMSNHPLFIEIGKCNKLVTSEMAKKMLQDEDDFVYKESDPNVCDEM